MRRGKKKKGEENLCFRSPAKAIKKRAGGGRVNMFPVAQFCRK